MSWPARSAPPVAPWRRQPWRVCWFWWRGRLHCWWTWAASKTQKLSAIGSGSDRLSLPPSLVTTRSHSNAQSPDTSVKNVRKRFHQPTLVYSSDIYMECWNVKVCVLQNQRYHTSETALTSDSVTSSSCNAWPEGTVWGRTSYKMWTTLTFGFS